MGLLSILSLAPQPIIGHPLSPASWNQWILGSWSNCRTTSCILSDYIGGAYASVPTESLMARARARSASPPPATTLMYLSAEES